MTVYLKGQINRKEYKFVRIPLYILYFSKYNVCCLYTCDKCTHFFLTILVPLALFCLLYLDSLPSKPHNALSYVINLVGISFMTAVFAKRRTKKMLTGI